jgi:hypothetical protein
MYRTKLCERSVEAAEPVDLTSSSSQQNCLGYVMRIQAGAYVFRLDITYSYFHLEEWGCYTLKLTVEAYARPTLLEQRFVLGIWVLSWDDNTATSKKRQQQQLKVLKKPILRVYCRHSSTVRALLARSLPHSCSCPGGWGWDRSQIS